MRSKTFVLVSIVILVACGLAGGLAVRATLADPGSSSTPAGHIVGISPGAIIQDAGGEPVISYQGVLKDNATGDAYAGMPNMKFTIYEGGTPGGGGVEVWTETQNNVEISGEGYFSTLIGSGIPIGNDRFSQSPSSMFLEVSVGTSVLQAMAPRQRLAANPYSFHAYYAGTAAYAGLAAYANDAGTLGTHDSNYFMAKGVYDYNPEDNVVDIAANANALNSYSSSAFMLKSAYDNPINGKADEADNADTLDTYDSTAFMLESAYDTNIPGDGHVDHADFADATGAWAPSLSAGEPISIGQVVGIDESGDLVAGCGNLGETKTIMADIDEIAITKVSDDTIAVAYHSNGDDYGQVRLCEMDADSTWTRYAPVNFGTTTPSNIQVEYVDIGADEYIVISYTADFRGHVWLGKISGTNIVETDVVVYGYTSSVSIARLPGTNKCIVVYLTNSSPSAMVVKINSATDKLYKYNAFTSGSATNKYLFPQTIALSSTQFVSTGPGVSTGGQSWYGETNGSGTVTQFASSNGFYSSSLSSNLGFDNFGNDLLVFFSDTSQTGAYANGILSGNSYDFSQYYGFISGGIDFPSVNIVWNGSNYIAIATYMDMLDAEKGKMKLVDISAGGDITSSNDSWNFSNQSVTNTKTLWMDSGNTFVVAYIDRFDDQTGKLVTGQREWVEPVGIAISDSSPIDVAVGGVVTGLSGLTAGSTYYGTLSGGLTTDYTGVKIGRAISTTELVLGIRTEQ